MHSVCSDGVLKPEALVEYAFKMGINAVSLTDHDTCDGTAKAMSAAARLGIDFLPGAELSANIPDTDDDIHILAYCMDMSSDESQRYFEAMGEERRERARKTAHRLSGMGIKNSSNSTYGNSSFGGICESYCDSRIFDDVLYCGSILLFE